MLFRTIVDRAVGFEQHEAEVERHVERAQDFARFEVRARLQLLFMLARPWSSPFSTPM